MRLLVAAVAMAGLWVVSIDAAAQTGTAPYCLRTNTGTRCIFGTMGECEAAKGRTTFFEQCMTRTDAHGTTGLGERPAPSGPPSYPDLPPVKPRDLGR